MTVFDPTFTVACLKKGKQSQTRSVVSWAIANVWTRLSALLLHF